MANPGKTTDAMLDKISDLMAERARLRAAIRAATTRYETALTDDTSSGVATDMYIALAAAGDLEQEETDGPGN